MHDRDLYTTRYLGYNWKRHKNWDYEDYLIEARGKFDWRGPVAIYPEQKNLRMRSQHGLFTIFGKDIRALERQQPSVVEKSQFRLKQYPPHANFCKKQA
jgi:hypothetical protein